MGRPRKDGSRSKSPVRIGRARPTGNRNRTWSVRAYGPTPTAPHGRVAYRDPLTGRQTTAVPAVDETVDELFDRIERSLDQKVATGTTRTGDGTVVVRDIASLLELYIDWLESLHRSDAYIQNRRNLAEKWILPAIGTVLVRDWSPEHSLKVINKARDVRLSPARIEDLGSTLSGMRNTAQRKRPGGRWLALDENPLADVSYSRGGTTQGAARDFVQPRYRPATDRVEGAIVAATELRVLAWMPVIIAIAAFCALRLSEQLALRAIDVDLRNRRLDVNGVWKVEAKAAVRGDRRRRWRSPQTKNGMDRTVPYPGRLHPQLVESCRMALGMHANASEEEVANAIEAERERRAAMRKDGDWRRVQLPLADESWLFVDQTGVPPTKERFNDMWRLIRDSIRWPSHIKYKNLRHHAALWWRQKGFEWEEIAEWDGHDVPTLLKYYTIPEEKGAKRARKILDDC